MTSQDKAFKALLTRIAMGETAITGEVDANTLQKLISFGYASGTYASSDGELSYVDVRLTKTGRAALEELDRPSGNLTQ